MSMVCCKDVLGEGFCDSPGRCQLLSESFFLLFHPPFRSPRQLGGDEMLLNHCLALLRPSIKALLLEMIGITLVLIILYITTYFCEIHLFQLIFLFNSVLS